MPTPHINAAEGDFAKVLLMPGDPVRAKWIADTFLNEAILVTDVRGILGFTGYSKYNHKRISVMASGMGMPSVMIYTTELFRSYGVETIIRVGTAGSYKEEIDLKDVLICSEASSDSNINYMNEKENKVRTREADKDLLETAIEIAKQEGKKYHVGNIYSADIFYDKDPDFWKSWKARGVMGVEMESYALYMNANTFGKRALCLLTATDSFVKTDKLTSEERALGLREMVEIAVKTAEKFAD